MYAMGFPGSSEQDEVPAVVRSPQTAQPISPLSLAGMTRCDNPAAHGYPQRLYYARLRAPACFTTPPFAPPAQIAP